MKKIKFWRWRSGSATAGRIESTTPPPLTFDAATRLPPAGRENVAEAPPALDGFEFEDTRPIFSSVAGDHEDRA